MWSGFPFLDVSFEFVDVFLFNFPAFKCQEKYSRGEAQAAAELMYPRQ